MSTRSKRANAGGAGVDTPAKIPKVANLESTPAATRSARGKCKFFSLLLVD